MQDAEQRPKFPHIIEVLRRLMANEMSARRAPSGPRRPSTGSGSNLSDDRQNSGLADMLRTGDSGDHLNSDQTQRSSSVAAAESSANS